MSFKALTAMSGVVGVLSSLLFLCSCAPKKVINNRSKTAYCSNTNHIDIEEARQWDMIVPLGFTCTSKQTHQQKDGSVFVIRYEGNQSIDRAVNFYRREMEAAGWALTDFSHDKEGLFYCHKGKLECFISIHSKGKTIIVISYKAQASPINRQASDIALINKPFDQGNMHAYLDR